MSRLGNYILDRNLENIHIIIFFNKDLPHLLYKKIKYKCKKGSFKINYAYRKVMETPCKVKGFFVFTITIELKLEVPLEGTIDEITLKLKVSILK